MPTAAVPASTCPPHNHTTWAVIAGIEGSEENRFYARTAAGPQPSGGQDVGPGVAVGFLPEELHSIHVQGEVPVLNFHMYGLALDRLHRREFWDRKSESWKIFPAQEGIIDRRGD